MNQRIITTVGVDVGTSAIKVAVVQSPAGGGRDRVGAKRLALETERLRRRDPRVVAETAIARALEVAGVAPAAVHYLATTGEGEVVEHRTGHFYGMTAHARGALFIDPEVRGVIDLGALHGRVIRFDDHGKVLDYRMTSQCASGSGQFLENIARYLGVTLEEIGPLAKQADRAEKISGICAVLAETDVINMVSRGIPIPAILRGIHDSIATRLVKLLKGIKVRGPVMLTGGLNGDVGLLHSLKRSAEEHGLADSEIRSHEAASYAGALGAALWGAYRHERLEAPAIAPATAVV
ncbi:MAG: benzoyl-CoA reductase subunit D [Myxococcota bacterium]